MCMWLTGTGLGRDQAFPESAARQRKASPDSVSAFSAHCYSLHTSCASVVPVSEFYSRQRLSQAPKFVNQFDFEPIFKLSKDDLVG